MYVRGETCNALRRVSKLCEDGHLVEAINSADFLNQQGQLSVHVLFRLLKGCIETRNLESGRRVHDLILRAGFWPDCLLGNHLIRLYTLDDSLTEAREVFDKLPVKDNFIWTSIITAYAKHGKGEQAVTLFFQMLRSNVNPNSQTYAAALSACAGIGALSEGQLIHTYVLQRGLESDVLVCNSLIHMYCKCKALSAARTLFLGLPLRTVVSWTAMIGGYVQEGDFQEAFQLFQMMQKQGIKPDRVTFLGMLKACSNAQDLELGRAIHAQMLKLGVELDAYLGSTLVNMYAKCGSITEARHVFLGLSYHDVVSWNTLVVGYATHGQFLEALRLFERMLKEGLKPNTVTYVGVLKACGGIAALEKGESIHSQLTRSGFESNLFVGNALIDMYAKCGRMEKAIQVFRRLKKRDLVSWNSIIAGFSQQGLGEDALLLFKEMCQLGVKPDMVTLVCVLSACSHAGLVDEAYSIFKSMSIAFGISPSLEHYTCMVDLLCRSGNLIDACTFVDKMPIPPNVALWMALLGACKTHGNVEIGKYAFDSIIKLEPGNTSAYALLSNIYAMAGRRSDEAFIRKEMCRP